MLKVRPRFREMGVESIVDVALDGDYDKEVFTDMTNVALMCASFNKNDRPAMKVLRKSYLCKKILVMDAILNWS